MQDTFARARTRPSARDGMVYCIQAKVKCTREQMYLAYLCAKYLCSRAHSAARPSSRDDRVSCIQLAYKFLIGGFYFIN